MIQQQHNNTCYLQFNHYQQFPDLVHGIFTRQGGYSKAPYHSLNTSTSPLKQGDSVDNVIHNRQLVLQALEIQEYPTATVWQVHKADIATLDLKDEWRTDWAYHSYYLPGWTPQTIRKADAIITRERGIALALSFADCVPIVFYDPQAQVIGVTHGGWRGTARGIVLATVEKMVEQFGCLPENIYAGIGPSISTCCYEVSKDVQQIFMGCTSFEDSPVQEHYRELVRKSAVFSFEGRLCLDLSTTNYNQLVMAGLRHNHIEVADICTACHTDHFFSHRAEQGITGRFPVLMALRA